MSLIGLKKIAADSPPAFVNAYINAPLRKSLPQGLPVFFLRVFPYTHTVMHPFTFLKLRISDYIPRGFPGILLQTGRRKPTVLCPKKPHNQIRSDANHGKQERERETRHGHTGRGLITGTFHLRTLLLLVDAGEDYSTGRVKDLLDQITREDYSPRIIVCKVT